MTPTPPGQTADPLDYSQGLLGPVVTKELRIASRRLRTIWLRMAYLLGLAIVAYWSLGSFSTVRIQVPLAPASVGLMADIGRSVTSNLLWFQFVITQILTVFIVSRAFKTELRHRSLATLLSAPISSAHIVRGIVLGRMVPVLMLIALGLPVLTMLRITGGITWSTVATAIGLNLTAVVLTAAIIARASLARKPRPLRHWLFWYGGTAAVLELAGQAIPMTAILLVHPATGFKELLSSRLPISNTHMALVGTGILLSLLLAFVLLCQAASRLRPTVARWMDQTNRSTPMLDSFGASGVRGFSRLAGLWNRFDRLITYSFTACLIMTLLLCILSISYLPLIWHHSRFDHRIHLISYFVLATMLMVVLSATSIASDRETGCLPILLTAPVGDLYFLARKTKGVFLRACLPMVLFAVHLLVSTLNGDIPPTQAGMAAILMASAMAMLLGTGLALSASLPTATTAAVTMLLVIFCLWFLPPLALPDAFSEMTPISQLSRMLRNQKGIRGIPPLDLDHVALSIAANFAIAVAGVAVARVNLRRRLFA